jgi:RNA polymerase sigma-70 factor (ECF subfamily)
VRAQDLVSRPGDLYLAWACADGDPCALAHFDRIYLAPRDFHGRLNLSPDVVDELRQQVRIRLLVGDSPRIGRYSGRGPLAAWVRTCAVRLGLNVLSAWKSRASDIEALDALVADGAGPEQAVLRARYAGKFQFALERSFLALGQREKALLRMHYVDGLGIEAIGQVHRVHRATVARWLAAVRERVLMNLWEELEAGLCATSSECRGLLASMRQHLEIDFERVLESELPTGT